MEDLVFVTGNIHKGYEIEEKFKKEEVPVEVVKMDFKEPEINDVEIVSKSKALEAYEKLQRPCFVIDSGFYIHNYPGNPNYPGAMARRSGISENVEHLLEILKDTSERSCEFVDCLTYFDGSEIHTFFGRDEGVISYEMRGRENKAMRSPLWYVFIPNNCTKTLAEMTDEERLKRRDGHISAKEQFLIWYKDNYLKGRQYVKK